MAEYSCKLVKTYCIKFQFCMAPQSTGSHPFRRRKRHIGERIAEFTIRVTASVSILMIFLILVFVMREAWGIISYLGTSESVASAGTAQESSAHNSSSNSDSQPDSYGEEPSTTDEPESYNPDVEETITDTAAVTAGDAMTADEPESYNPDVTDYSQEAKTTVGTTEQSESAVAKTLSENIAGQVWQPVSSEPKYGIMPLILGTAKTTFLAILIAAPLAILAAIYTAFFAPRRLREIMKPIIELIAGFPSVVVGFFCLMLVADFVQSTFGVEYRLNAIVGGIGLAIAIVPVIFTITEDSLMSVPKSYREASLALGATEWQTAFKVMLPAALPGVVAAVLLGVGRAFGETMIALMATGNAAVYSASMIEPVRTLAATIGAEMGEVIWGSLHYNLLFMLGVLLFLVSFIINALTEFFVKGMLAKKFQGEA